MWLDPMHGGKTDDVRVLFYQATLTPLRSVPHFLEYGTSVRSALSREYGRATAGRLRQEIRRAASVDSDLYEMPRNNFFTGGLNPGIQFTPHGDILIDAEISIKPDNSRIRVQVA